MKYLFTVLFMASFLFAQAQESMKGNWRLDQNNSQAFLFSSKRAAPYSSFSATPSFANFVGKKTLFGLDTEYFYFRREHRFGGSSRINRWNYLKLEPWFRKYMGNNALKPFIGAQFRIAFDIFNGNNTSDLAERLSPRLIDFDLDLEVGLAYFVNDYISFDLAFECAFLYDVYGNLLTSSVGSPSGSISTYAFGAWDFQYIPNIQLSTNIYLPSTSKAIRKTIDPFEYQSKGNSLIGISSNWHPRTFDRNRANKVESTTYLDLSYHRFVSNKWLVGGQASISFVKQSLRIRNIEGMTKRFINLPNTNIQLVAAFTTKYHNNSLYNPTSGESHSSRFFENRLAIGLQYIIQNGLIKLDFGNTLQSASVPSLNLKGNHLIQDLNLEYEVFWAENASFFASTKVIPNHKFLGIDYGLFTFIPAVNWHFGFGYRAYFVN